MRPHPESLDLIRVLLQRLALITGTLTEIEMLYEVPDAKFWQDAPLIRPDVVSYFAWMVDCGAVGKIDVFLFTPPKRARIRVYDLARDGRAILAYLRACEARQVEQMQSDLQFLANEVADAFFVACRNGSKTAQEAAVILKADPEIERDGIWKQAFNRAYQNSKQNEREKINQTVPAQGIQEA